MTKFEGTAFRYMQPSENDPQPNNFSAPASHLTGTAENTLFRVSQ